MTSTEDLHDLAKKASSEMRKQQRARALQKAKEQEAESEQIACLVMEELMKKVQRAKENNQFQCTLEFSGIPSELVKGIIGKNKGPCKLKDRLEERLNEFCENSEFKCYGRFFRDAIKELRRPITEKGETSGKNLIVYHPTGTVVFSIRVVWTPAYCQSQFLNGSSRGKYIDDVYWLWNVVGEYNKT